MALEAATRITDVVVAELIDCEPVQHVTIQAIVLPTPPEVSPVERAAEATIEQTGAGPPPHEDQR